MLFQVAEDSAAPANTQVPPAAVMTQLLFGKHIAYSISAVARLGVADHMTDEPVGLEKLAAGIGAQPAALYRVLRALAAVGVFEQTAERRFRLTPLGALLKTDAPGSLRYFAMQLGDSWSVRPWERFADTLKTGEDAVSLAFGKNAFELLAEEPAQAEMFNRSMSALSLAMMEPLLAAYDFSPIRRLADVGGGHGKLMAAVLHEYEHMTGVVYDLPEVVAGARGQEHAVALGERLRFEAGSFFERVPAGCDAYMMKFILHDWSDGHCRTILQRVREQLPADGRVLVIEQIVMPTAELSFAKLLDLEMLALTVGGRERTQAEFEALFASAGLRLTRVVTTESPMCILEARRDG